ncbi:uncharacterized protein LOC120352692 [Nilaparvata lugens]|uniref:uncharacterized protein LOC120352692 n=1 Tax=Nilaparvata lugens TaxID=108931 RepID=UPI00193E6E65|nr:uncharacterized protein LOC120352692 [Nilaparvata lugens]
MKVPNSANSVCVPTSNSEKSVLEAIASFREEFNERSDSSELALKKMQEDIASVVKDLGSLKSQFEGVRKECEQNTSQVKYLRTENERLNTQLNLLKCEVSDLQQQTRKNNIIIAGVPRSRGENIFQILGELARLLQVNFNSYDVSAAHRLPSKMRDNRPPSIVVNFVSRQTKTQWIHARRVRKVMSAQELHPSFPNIQIYINDHLTENNNAIYFEARRQVKSGKLAAAWVADGRVLIKRTPTTNPQRVNHVEFFQQFIGQKSATIDGCRYRVTPRCSRCDK